MSVSTESACNEFVGELESDSELQELTREAGIEAAADAAGFDLTTEEIQEAVKARAENELSDSEILKGDYTMSWDVGSCHCP